MAEEKKTISFGFSKLKAPSKVIKPFVKTTSSKSQVNAVQYIDCLENQSIKVKDEILEEKKELVIPLKQANITRIIKKEPDLERVEVKQELNDNDSKVENISTKDAKVTVKVEVTDQGDANSLDAQARREILESLNNPDGDENETKVFSLPLTTNAPKEGEKEPTLDDYENIPIQEFGLAMLRGMGWKPDENKNNKPMDVILRPKGLGLGADKSATQTTTSKSNTNPEEAKLVKNCCVKITGGMFKNNYGKLESFNEDSGRVVVKLALGDEHVTVVESLLLRVTQSEYDKNSRVINMNKYEEYKEKDAKQSNIEKVKDKSENNHRGEQHEKQYSKYGNSSDSEYEEKKMKQYKTNEPRSQNKHEQYSKQESSRSRRDYQERKRKDSSDSEERHQTSHSTSKDKYESRSHHREKEYKSVSHKSRSRHYSDSDSEGDDKYKQKSNKKYDSNQKHTSTQERKKYSTKSRDSSSSSSSSEYEKHKKSSKHDKHASKYENKKKQSDSREKSRKNKKRHHSSSESEESSSDSSDGEKRKRHKKSKKKKTSDTSEEDSYKKRKKHGKKSKH